MSAEAPPQGQPARDGSRQIPLQELTARLGKPYTVRAVDGATVVSLPAANALWAVFATGAFVGASALISGLTGLFAASPDIGAALAWIAVGTFFVFTFGYFSWPAVVYKRLRIRPGQLSREWSLAGGPIIWASKDESLTRVIVRQGLWGAGGSTDQVIIDGARRYVADSVQNLPGHGSYRWLNNWRVGEASCSLISRPAAPWSSASPVMLALAWQLATALGTPVFFEIGKGRPPLIGFGAD